MKQKLQAQLDDCLLRDRPSLARRITAMDPSDQAAIRRLRRSIDKSVARKQSRVNSVPAVTFSGDLPVHDKLGEIAAAMANNAVVIVSGETGSGKTTQIPKLCLDTGRGASGLVGHTQPRRIAARAVAARLREELNAADNTVGYKIRHTDTSSPDSLIKVMTDGILLAELQGDPDLLQYDTLIIDEAHERSLNIDFLLGYIKRLLPRRPDLKVIITSATIDVERFSQHFNHAPVIEVSGRGYPVEVRYRPIADDDAEDDADNKALFSALDELMREGPGDILVFLEGEREIHETARLLRKQQYNGTDILPLYSRLTAARQAVIFRPHSKRHIVLATNVAETSLTIPGIHYVIDRGYARISRYSRRSKVQRLPTEKISRAAADQRMGRCGRVAAGTCIRLYSEADYEARPAFTDAEILRTNLAAVILQMKSLKLGDIEAFPFLDHPDRRYVNDGLRLLQELSALTKDNELTKLGNSLARLPVDPQLGRIVLAANEHGCMREVLIIVSALSIQDPRERPLEAREDADAAHATFNDEESDFKWFLNLWQFYQLQKKKLSQNRLRKCCKQHFISHVRMREWQDIHHQLNGMVRELGLSHAASCDDYSALHCALLAGFPAQVAVRTDKHSYSGTRNNSLHIFPGSSQFARLPKWVVAAELVETSRLYARTVARIDPQWLLKIAAHLLQHDYYSPHWDQKAGQVLCYEKISLYGLVVAADRKINYGTVNRADARQIFIQHALIEQAITENLPFLQHNRQIIADIHRLEAKGRRRDLLDEQALRTFYDERLPDHVYNIPALKKWLKQQDTHDESLRLQTGTVLQASADMNELAHYPDEWVISNHKLAVDYHFEPGKPHDGVSVDVPLHFLNQLNPARLEQLVPGMFEEKINGMLRSLPKPVRRQLVPVPDTARECAGALAGRDGSLAHNLADYLFRSRGLDVPVDSFDTANLPEHLNIRLRILDNDNNLVDEGRDLQQLQAAHTGSARQEFRQAFSAGMDREGMTDWQLESIPESLEVDVGDRQVRLYPALVDEYDSVALRYFDTRDAAEKQMRGGLRRLFMLTLRKDIKYLIKHLLHIDKLCLWYAAIDNCDVLKADLVEMVVDRVFLVDQHVIRTQSEFEQRKNDGVRKLVSEADRICELAYSILQKYHSLTTALCDLQPSHAREDIEQQLDCLVYPRFLVKTPANWLQHYPRYLEAVERRLEKLSYDPARDEKQLSILQPYRDTCRKLLSGQEMASSESTAVTTYRWMLEEYRISLFAQEVKTILPVSGKRLDKQLDAIRREAAGNPGGLP